MNSRILMFATLAMAVFFLSSCVTRTSRDYGYVDYGGSSLNSTYIPLHQSTLPRGAVRVPNTVGNYGQPYATIPNGPYNNRMTYHHNHDEFNLNDVANMIDSISDSVANGLIGGAIFSNAINRNHHRPYKHKRYYRRHRW